MTWQFGDDEVVTEQVQTNNNSWPPHETVRNSRRLAWLLVFLTALTVSWTTGFYLGRVQQTKASLEAQIQSRLDVESWAWEQNDWDLFRSLLPYRTPSWRLKELQTMFQSAEPGKRVMRLVDYTVKEQGGLIDASIQVSMDDHQYVTRRTYRLLDGRWQLIRLSEYDG
ncbi:MAG: hypothetical protein ACE5HA_04755 [Anaerolineae bacterium]